FRIISNEINTFSKSQQRKILSDIKKNIVEHLKKTFSIDDTLIKSRNENRFISLDINYPTIFNRAESLRPHILVEFAFTTMAIDPIKLPVSSLVNELMEKDPEVSSIYCTDSVENACDKLSALMWRVADRDRTSADDDATIVRHLYDLAAMKETVIKHPGFKTLAVDTIQNDDGRSNKIKGLSLEQKISSLLNTLKEDKTYEKEYGTFVKGMFYGNEQLHDFKEAITLLGNLTEFIQ
ncbi:MAG: nucleotidyl transferase AbiEii/AbiGii toxin family protein, partial [Flavitalea sp.]